MTIPLEEKQTLKNTRDFLVQLIQLRITDIRSQASEIRGTAGRLLRHYPPEYRINQVYDKVDDSVDFTKQKDEN